MLIYRRTGEDGGRLEERDQAETGRPQRPTDPTDKVRFVFRSRHSLLKRRSGRLFAIRSAICDFSVSSDGLLGHSRAACWPHLGTK